MHEFAIGTLAGAAAGVASAALAGVLRARRANPTDPDGPALSDEDRTELADEFRTHAGAVRRQVTEYADALAGDDPQLRQALRRIEQEVPTWPLS